MPHWTATAFWIAAGRDSPRALPASTGALVEAGLLYAAVSVVDAALVMGGEHALTFGLVDLVLTGLTVTLCLLLRRRLFRLPQTLLAMLGVGAWLTLPSIALNGLHTLLNDAAQPGHAPLWVEIPLAAVLVWSLMTVARIFREALDVDFFTAMTVAMTYFLFDYLVLSAMTARLVH